MKKNKKVLVLFLSLFAILFLGIGLYGFSLSKVSKNADPINFTIEGGTSKIGIVNDLKNAGLIRSSFALKVYLFFHNDINLQAGKYELRRNMSAPEIIKKIQEGKENKESAKERLHDMLKPFKDKVFEITDNVGVYSNLKTIHPLFAGQRFSGKWILKKYEFPKKKTAKK